MVQQSLALLFLGVQELLILLAIALLIFGASRIPKLMRGMGEGIKEFRSAVKDNEQSDGDFSGGDSDGGGDSGDGGSD